MIKNDHLNLKPSKSTIASIYFSTTVSFTTHIDLCVCVCVCPEKYAVLSK